MTLAERALITSASSTTERSRVRVVGWPGCRGIACRHGFEMRRCAGAWGASRTRKSWLRTARDGSALERRKGRPRAATPGRPWQAGKNSNQRNGALRISARVGSDLFVADSGRILGGVPTPGVHFKVCRHVLESAKCRQASLLAARRREDGFGLRPDSTSPRNSRHRLHAIGGNLKQWLDRK